MPRQGSHANVGFGGTSCGAGCEVISLCNRISVRVQRKKSMEAMRVRRATEVPPVGFTGSAYAPADARLGPLNPFSARSAAPVCKTPA
jgi:hypothetical protein